SRCAFQAILWTWPVLEEHKLLGFCVLRIVAHPYIRPLLADESNQSVRIVEYIVTERKYNAFRSGFDLFDIGPAAQCLDRDHLQQVLNFERQLPKAVDEFGGKSIDIALVLDFGEPPIERQPHRKIRNIILRNEQCRSNGNLRRPSIGNWRGYSGF